MIYSGKTGRGQENDTRRSPLVSVSDGMPSFLTKLPKSFFESRPSVLSTPCRARDSQHKHHMNISPRSCALEMSLRPQKSFHVTLDVGTRATAYSFTNTQKQKHLFLRVLDVFFPHSCHNVRSCSPCWRLYRQVLWCLPVQIRSFQFYLSFSLALRWQSQVLLPQRYQEPA